MVLSLLHRLNLCGAMMIFRAHRYPPVIQIVVLSRKK